MSEGQNPQIEFPCDYPIKVIGDHSEDFALTVTRVVQQFDPAFDPATLTAQPSRNGRFISVRVTLRATGEEQLQKLFAALKATGQVHMVV